MVDDGRRRASALMSPGGAGWFVTFVARMRQIYQRHGFIKDELLLSDLIIDGWPELDVMPKREALRWVRCARIEVDHLLVEERVCEIIEARQYGDDGLQQVLLEAFPIDIELRKELSAAQRRDWISRAQLVSRGKYRRRVTCVGNGQSLLPNKRIVVLQDEALLEHERGLRINSICGLIAAERNFGIYFVTADHVFVKIGFATNVAARMRALQTSVPQPLHLLLVLQGTIAEERALHARFANDRASGEWFRLSAQIHKFIEDASEGR